MKKSEIISISLGVAIFVTTNLALKDIFGKSNFIVIAIIGGVSAIFSFWLSYKLLPKWNDLKKLVFTLLYLVVIITSAVFLTNHRKVERKLQLVGKWISPPNAEGASELIFDFKQNDSLNVTIDSQRVDLTYEIKNGDQIVAIGESEDQKFKWSIVTLTFKKLIIGDSGQTMELMRIE